MKRIAVLTLVVMLLLPSITPAATSGGIGGNTPKACQECVCESVDWLQDKCDCVTPRADLTWGTEGCRLLSISMDGKSVSLVCAPEGSGCLYTFVQPN